MRNSATRQVPASRIRPRFLLALLCLPCLLLAPRGASTRTASGPAELRVKFLPGQEATGIAALQQFGPQILAASLEAPEVTVDGLYLTYQAAIPQIGWYRFRLPDGAAADVAAALIRGLPGILNAEPVQRVSLFLGPPNDPGYSEYEDARQVLPLAASDKATWIMQWNMRAIHALEGWNVWPGRYFTAADRRALPPEEKPLVAIIDTGIDAAHLNFAHVDDPSTDAERGGQINRALSRNMIDGGTTDDATGGLEATRRRGDQGDGATGRGDGAALSGRPVAPSPQVPPSPQSSVSDPKDEFGHGTFVAGIVAASGNNGRYAGKSERGFGVIGVGYNAQIAALRVVDRSGESTDTDVIEAILYAADHGALVISMSLGLDGGYSQALQDAVNYAWAKGCVLVAAAGNDGVDSVRRYPAACDKVIGVGATTGAHGMWPEQRAAYSNYGLPISVAAPGGDVILDVHDVDTGIASIPIPSQLSMWIWSTAPTYETPLTASLINGHPFRYYGYQEGTSAACPHVAGLAALYAGYRHITPATPGGNLKIEQAIERGASDLARSTNGGWINAYGFGRIDAGNTMKERNARDTRLGTVTGQVYYNATAVQNGTITATPVGGTRRYFAGSQSDGTYRLVNLPAGDYDVTAKFFGQTKSRRVAVVAGANLPGVTFYLGEIAADLTPPGAPQLRLGRVSPGPPLTVDVVWWASDPESGIDHYEYAIGSKPGAADLLEWKSADLRYDLTLTLPDHLRRGDYYLSVRAVNGVGLVSGAAVSPAINVPG